jgi:membrane-associated phospholipid phosphatase
MDWIIRFDSSLAKRAKRLPSQIRPLMQAATLCGGSVPVLIILCIEYFVAQPNAKRSVVFLASSILIDAVLKEFIHRPRPDTLYVSLMRFKTHSFPSGHAFGSITAYGFITYQLLIYTPLAWSVVAATLCSVLIATIGISRVYLGAHYPSDVIGGWIFGSVCLGAAIAIA